LLFIAFILSLVSAWGNVSDTGHAKTTPSSHGFFAAAEQTPLTPDSSKTSGKTIHTVTRDQDGLFRIDAIVGSAQVDFVIDSGATHVFLSQKDAARIGIDSSLAAGGEIRTATGTDRVQWVIAPPVRIAGRNLKSLPVGIIPGEQSLLGQQGLAQLGRLTIDKAKLTFEE